MSVRIRLKKFGTKNKPTYRIVVADRRDPRDGRFIEEIGTYDPRAAKDGAKVKLDRAEHWIKVGAQPTDTVRAIIKKAKAQGK